MKILRRIIINNKIKVLTGDSFEQVDEDQIKFSSYNYKFLSPVDPKVIVCVHLNYRSRLNELNRVQPEAPTYFLKPVSCINSHLNDVVRPAGCKFLNYEGEIALVVSKKAKNIELEKIVAMYKKIVFLPSDFIITEIVATLVAGPAIKNTRADPGSKPLLISVIAIGTDAVAQT